MPRYLQQLVKVLLAQRQEDGRLFDSQTGQESPRHHYAPAFTALAAQACGLPSAEWQPLLTHWLSLPDADIGHGPINRLAFNLMAEHADADLLALLDAAKQRVPLRQDYVSNNWNLLSSLVALIEADTADKPALSEAFCAQAGRWLTRRGGFIDFPANPERGRCTTPLAYHGKFLLLTALADRAFPNDNVRRMLLRGIDWALRWQVEGLGGGFGRSTCSLFGDTGVLFALLYATATGLEDYRHVGSKMLAHWFRRRLDTGEFFLSLRGLAGQAGGWDPYMHHSVYNAFFAGMMAFGVRTFGDPFLHATLVPPKPTEDFYDRDAGLVSLSRGGWQIMASLSGQPIQTLERHVLDARYGALQPFHVRRGDKIVMPPPNRLSAAELAQHPVRAGATPIFTCGDGLYTITHTNAFHFDATTRGVVIWGEGALHRVCLPETRRFSRLWFEGVFDKVTHSNRFFLSRPMRLPLLRKARIARAWVFDFEDDSIHLLTVLFGARLPGVKYLNPHGCVWAGDLFADHSFFHGSVHHDTATYPNSMAPAMAACARPMVWPEETWVSHLCTGKVDAVTLNLKTMRFSTRWGEYCFNEWRPVI